jgi:alkylhydroperoxidase family enzyme
MRKSLPEDKEVTIANKAIFKKLSENVGIVPNLYKALAFSRDGLNRYLSFQYGQDVITGRQKAALYLVVSQVNNCIYTLEAYSHIGLLYDFTPEQILEIRAGSASFDSHLQPMISLAKEIAELRGHLGEEIVQRYLDAGYTREHLVDCILAIGEITIANNMYAAFKYPLDILTSSNQTGKPGGVIQN